MFDADILREHTYKDDGLKLKNAFTTRSHPAPRMSRIPPAQQSYSPLLSPNWFETAS